MTENRLRLIVAEAVKTDRDINRLTEHLKDLKSQLVTEASTRVDEHTPTEGGGRSWTIEGVGGCIARVTFPGAKLRDKVAGEGKTIEKLRTLAGKAFDLLFRPAVTWKPIVGFREEAAKQLGRDAPKLIRALESKSATTVSFETKETV